MEFWESQNFDKCTVRNKRAPWEKILEIDKRTGTFISYTRVGRPAKARGQILKAESTIRGLTKGEGQFLESESSIGGLEEARGQFLK